MKFGIRKPSLKKSFKARTTGKLKRSVKKTLIPGYGKKGMGWIKNPKKAAYNKVYKKTTVSLFPAGTPTGKTKRKKSAAKSGGSGVSRSNVQYEYRIVADTEVEGEAVKICKFCGSENPDSATVCASCAGNEFKYKCGNCGNEFDEGAFCPKCGVKAGAKAKKCPNCGAEYYSAACPDCGYTANSGSGTTVYVQPVKKRKTWLWVLGWIFIFPVPLTILTARSQKLSKGAKIGIIAAAWIVYLLIGIAGGSGNENTAGAGNEIPASAVTESVTAEAESKNLYADDPVVDRFISEFNESSGMEITGIEKGNIRTKYFGYADGRYLEILNANDSLAKAFCLTINGGKDEEAVQSMFKVFRAAVKILDPSVTDDEVDAALAEFEKNGYANGYSMGKSLLVKYSNTQSAINPCYIEIDSSDYK